MAMITVRLKGEDGTIIGVDYEAAIISKSIKAMLDVLPREKLNKVIIPLDIDSLILFKVLQWMEHYTELYKKNNYILEEMAEEKFRDYDTWDERFFEANVETLYGIINAADYLDVRGLFRHVFNRILTRPPEPSETSFKKDQKNEEVVVEEVPINLSVSTAKTRKRKAEDFLQSTATSKRQR